MLDGDWETAHLSALGHLPGGEDLVKVLQQDSERDGLSKQPNPPTPMQGGPAFAVLNNGRSSQGRDIVRLL